MITEFEDWDIWKVKRPDVYVDATFRPLQNGKAEVRMAVHGQFDHVEFLTAVTLDGDYAKRLTEAINKLVK